MALATDTDQQELTGINRTVLKKGLEVINSNPSLGIKKLLESSGKSKTVTVYDLGWVLGPRINALGRMENASLGVELLTTSDETRAEEIAHMLGQTNVRRQDETEKMYEIANVEYCYIKCRLPRRNNWTSCCASCSKVLQTCNCDCA